VTLPTSFYIKRGDTLLATLDQCQFHEMFWQTCHFMPAAAYEDVRSILEARSEAADDESLDRATLRFAWPD
jgi:hypothetical protein